MDHYTVLGVHRTATTEEITKAYRRKAMRLHPDRCPDDSEAAAEFVQVQEAYAVLSDPERRERYDRTGSDTGERDDAETQLEALFLSLCEQAEEPEYVDMTRSIRDSVKKQQTEILKAIEENKWRAKRFRKALKRITRKTEGPNRLGIALERQLEDLAQKLAGLEEQHAFGFRILEKLDEYEYAYEEKPRPMPGEWVGIDWGCDDRTATGGPL